jgi:hypothetical protein
MTSRGVKCSPAVSFEASENRRINSSKMYPIARFGTFSGWRSISQNFDTMRNKRFDFSKRPICCGRSKRSMKMSRTFAEKPFT